MANDLVFAVLGNAVLIGWLCLLLALVVNTQAPIGRALYVIGGAVIPAALATLPIWEHILRDQAVRGDLFSLSGIETRFSDINILFLLYFEALAFSLFVAGLIVRDREKHGVPRFIAAPALFFMFFKGPIGALLYGAARWLIPMRRAQKEA